MLILCCVSICGCQTVKQTGQGFEQVGKGFVNGLKDDFTADHGFIQRTDNWFRENFW